MSDHDLRKLELAALGGDPVAVEKLQAARCRIGLHEVVEVTRGNVDGVFVDEICLWCCAALGERFATHAEGLAYFADHGYFEEPPTLSRELERRGFDPDSESDHNSVDVMRDMRAEGFDV